MQEDSFRARLDAELDDELGPPIGTLVAAATADGVRRRRRRSIVQLTAGTLGVAAVVTGASFAAGHVGRDSGAAAPGAAAGVQPAPAKPASPNTSATTPPAVTATTPSSAASTTGPVTVTSGKLPTEYESSQISGLPAAPPGQTGTTAQAMLLLLEQNVTRVAGAGDFSHTCGYAPDGDPRQTQKTTFMADLYWNHSTIAVRYTLPPNHQGSKTGPDGDLFRWNTPGVTGTSEVKLEKGERGVELTRADGSKVMVLEINGPETGSTGPDRPDMPLTSEQLEAIARDPHWGPTMSRDFVAQAAEVIHLEPIY